MKNKTFLLIMLMCLLSFPSTTNAFCYSKDKVKFQKLADNIRYNYVFDENSKTFNIIFTNLQANLSLNGIAYPNQEVVLTGFAPGSSNNFIVKTNDSICYQETIKTIYVTLPVYNVNYNDPLCEGLHDYDICQKWGKYISDREEFEKQINSIVIDEETIDDQTVQEDYKGLFDYLAEFFVNTYYIVLPIVIIICLFGIYKMNKKDKLF